MKITHKILFLLFLSLSHISVQAAKPSCQDLDEMAIVLNQLSKAIEQNANIREGDEIDDALGKLVEHLALLAEAENESDLSDHVLGMADGWNKMAIDRFADSLAGVVTSLDRIYQRDCSS